MCVEKKRSPDGLPSQRRAASNRKEGSQPMSAYKERKQQKNLYHKAPPLQMRQIVAFATVPQEALQLPAE